ncbi:MAG: lipoprotein [Phaeodactylibacter sp.]|nr:lipoprotein [Phaeodactylibacter sp.]
MKNYLFFALLLVLLTGCNKKETARLEGPDDLIGYWKYDGHGEEGERYYSAVPSDEGLSIPEKSLMLEFRADGFFRQFFWNWCATPPTMPSDWQNGSWQQLTEEPLVIRVWFETFPEDNFQEWEILEIDETHLVIK